MKFTKIAIAAVFALSFGRAYAFHSGGVAECDGCHTMHNSLTEDSNATSEPMQPDGTVNRGVGVTGAFLLQGNDVSSTCLICHGKDGAGSYHIFAPSTTSTAIDTTKLNFTPGGDFSWLKRDFLYTQRGTVVSDPGKRHGHNVLAVDFGLSADSRVAPPGAIDPVDATGFSQTFNGQNFNCASCHDPHGKKRLTASDTYVTTGSIIKGSGSYGGTSYIPGVDPNVAAPTETAGAYRLLGGAGWLPKSNEQNAFKAFVNEPPIALAPSSYNQSESTYSGKQSANQVIVVYGSGMSEWCQNCHPAMHSDKSMSTGTKSGEFLRHPAGSTAKMSAVVQANYNSYVKTGDLTGGASNYDSLIPFETGQSRSQIQTTNAPNNKTYVAVSAGATSNPMCLSCHRAHASAFGSSMRWFMENEFIVSGGTYKPEPVGGRDSATMQAGMYMRPASAYATYQRNLCNKCHAKD